MNTTVRMGDMTQETANRRMTCTLERLERRTNSPSGNPRYLMHLEGHLAPLKTADDIADAYKIMALHGDGETLTFDLDARGDIIRISE